MAEFVQEDFFDEAEGRIKYKLQNFEGPLDLLLHLIRESKVDIKDIKLSEITNQFLAYIQNLDVLDMDNASEFISMAATLLEIKSKSLLPKPKAESIEEDEEQKLLRKLEEYKLFKEASENLKTIENINRFYKEPETDGEYKIVLTDFDFDGLISAFSRVLFRVDKTTTPVLMRQVARDRFTVAEKILQIKTVLADQKLVCFTHLFDVDYTKSEMITTFLAVLELLKYQQIKVIQNKHYGEIEITINEEGFSESFALLKEEESEEAAN